MQTSYLRARYDCTRPAVRFSLTTLWQLFLFACTALPAVSANAEVVDVKTRDTSVRLLIEGPVDPTHVLAIFAGGHGSVEIADDGSLGWGRGNFAVRTRAMFHRERIATAVVAAPEDMGRDLIMRRASEEYATDFGNVIAYLRSRFNKPVWGHGTSRGAISVVYPVSKIRQAERRPDGIVLSSSVTRAASWQPGDHVLNADLARITAPALVLAHRNDGCVVTPPEDAQQIADALVNARIRRVIVLEGGDDQATGDPCQAMSQHGFRGIERDAVAAISAFIRSPQ